MVELPSRMISSSPNRGEIADLSTTPADTLINAVRELPDDSLDHATSRRLLKPAIVTS